MRRTLLAAIALLLSFGCPGGSPAGTPASPELHVRSRSPAALEGSRPRAARAVDWVLYVYMAADNDLDSWAPQDFDAMSNALVADAGQTRIAVVVLLDRLEDTWDGYYELKPGVTLEDPTGRFPRDRTVQTGELDTNNPQTLRDFLDWGEQQYQATNQALLIWSHGQGWRSIVNDDLRLLTDRLRGWGVPNSRIAEVEKTLRTGPLSLDAFRRLSSALQTSRLPARRLQEALGILRRLRGKQPGNSTLGTLPIHYDESNDRMPGPTRPQMLNRDVAGTLHDGELKLLGFDACNMDMLETAYEFRAKAEVMVGSEDVITTWPLARILGDLQHGDPQHDSPWSTEGLAGQIVDDAQNYPLVETLAVIRLSGIQHLAEQVSTLAEPLKVSLTQEPGLIATVRTGIAEFGKERGLGLHHVDLLDFLDHLGTAGSNVITQPMIDQVAQSIQDVVIANYADGQHDGNHGLAHARGLAIYFPPDGAQFVNDKYSKGDYRKPQTPPSHVSFVNEQQWADFINFYAQKSPCLRAAGSTCP